MCAFKPLLENAAMKRLKSYRHRTFQTPSGRRLLGYARGQLVLARPEELVRQDVIRSLVEEYGYPWDYVLSEEPIARGTADRRRADVIVRLPRARIGTVSLHEPARDEQRPDDRPSYERDATRIRQLLSGFDSLEVLAIPERFTAEVDGVHVELEPLGFEWCDLSFSLVARDCANALREAPPQLVFQLLGCGVTSAEQRIARELGMAQVTPTDPASDQLTADVDELLELLGPEAWVTRGLSHDGFTGWVLVRHVDSHADVLVRAETDSDEWAKGIYRAAESAPRLELPDGRVADRARLSSLETGARVAVELADGSFVEGIVEEVLKRAARVRTSDGVIVATQELREGQAWLVGVVEEDQADSRPRDEAPVDADDLAPLLIVECKAPGVALTREVLRQGADYAETVGARFVTVTNGDAAQSFLRESGELTLVEDIPSYEEVLSRPELEIARAAVSTPGVPPLPKAARSREGLTRLHARWRGVVGDDLDQRHWWPVLKLQDALIYATWPRVAPFRKHGVEILEDLGLRFHAAGNAGGGTWAGFYRDVLIRDPSGDERVMALMVMASQKTIEHPHWGNRRGRSQLIVALSRDARFESHLQADLGRSLEAEGDLLRLRHSGRMTAGRGGVKISEVLGHVSESVPDLVGGGRVELGRVPVGRAPEWEEAAEVLARIAAYITAREQLKAIVKARRQS
ncbi:MAG: hypothetical protein CMN31_10680 [Sandaracinus sp.]|nr:hypothetical protein [Sandaracinus sp.]MBJ71788.1 hypothetical protein [Sandaracinus sp.]